MSQVRFEEFTYASADGKPTFMPMGGSPKASATPPHAAAPT